MSTRATGEPDPNWAAYLAGIIETYLKSNPSAVERETAIAGIIERRMCFVYTDAIALAADEKIAVNVAALRQILKALIGPGHRIRELQATRSLHALGHPNPIDTLMEDYGRHIAAQANVATEGKQL